MKQIKINSEGCAYYYVRLPFNIIKTEEQRLKRQLKFLIFKYAVIASSGCMSYYVYMGGDLMREILTGNIIEGKLLFEKLNNSLNK